MTLNKLREEILRERDEKRAEVNKRFFKTGKGEYGEGDIFIGLSVPKCRKIAIKYSALPLGEVQKILSSKIHEERLIALEILVYKYENNLEDKEKIFEFYLSNTKFINNWDLVDLSAEYILGDFLFDKDKKILYELVKSPNLWERRISIISSFNFIKKRKFEDSLKLSKILLNDGHDLIHKAVGWMLREIGKRDRKVLKKFLNDNYEKIPRTMLRYAIERFSEEERKGFMRKGVSFSYVSL